MAIYAETWEHQDYRSSIPAGRVMFLEVQSLVRPLINNPLPLWPCEIAYYYFRAKH